MRKERKEQVSLGIQSIFQRLAWRLGGERTQEQESNCKGALRCCWTSRCVGEPAPARLWQVRGDWLQTAQAPDIRGVGDGWGHGGGLLS